MNLAKYIDHTLLKPQATQQEIEHLCQEALNYHFASVCVNPYWVQYAKQLLKSSDVAVCTVVGFPLGACTSETKVFETKQAILNGADEIDMVINIGALKSGDFDRVYHDIRGVVQAADGHLVKVIIETCLLDTEEKKTACALAMQAKADFVKTSTGFAGGGATVEDVRLMKTVVQNQLQVKASGGIRDEKTALSMIEAGASRLGTSSGVRIMKKK